MFREGLGRDFYGDLIDTLQRVGGYERRFPGVPPRNGNGCALYHYVYDFRLDGVRAARGLAELIARIRADFGDPQLKVDVVAHSGGGMIARYFVRHGTRDLPATGALEPTYEGAAAIRRLLLVGTPSLGTLQPVLSLLRGEEVGLRKIPPEVVATCTGITEMMPYPAVPWLDRPARRAHRRRPLRHRDVARLQLVGVRSAHRGAHGRNTRRRGGGSALSRRAP